MNIMTSLPQAGNRLSQARQVVATNPERVQPEQPVARLPRPVLLISGGSSRAVPLPELMHYLTHGGENSLGGVYHADREAEFAETFASAEGQPNVFALEYSKPFGSFAHNAKEIKKAIEAVREVTGAQEIDVVAECKGAMEMRQYAGDVEEGRDGVRNLVMLVPPNHGLTVAGQVSWLMGKLVEKLPWKPEKVAGYTTDKDTTTAVSSFNTDWKIGPWVTNKTLRGYNSPEHRAKESRVFDSITVVAGEGRNLLKGRLGPGLPMPLLRGDHAIPNWSAYLPHAQNFFYDGERAAHGAIKSHPAALAKVAEALTTDGQPVHDEAYSAKQPGLAPVGLRMAAWTGSMIGRGVVAHHALTGAQFGPTGTAFAVLGGGLAAWDGGADLLAATRESEGRGRNVAKGIAKLAQAAGVGMGLAGVGGWTSAALIGGGLAVSSALA